MTYILLSIILILLVTGAIFYFKFKANLKKNYVSKETIKKHLDDDARRGLIKLTFKFTKKNIVKVEVEFKVIEEADNAVRIKAIRINDINDLSYKGYHYDNMYLKSIDGNWYDKNSSNIHWIKERKSSIRKRNLKKVLKEE